MELRKFIRIASGYCLVLACALLFISVVADEVLQSKHERLLRDLQEKESQLFTTLDLLDEHRTPYKQYTDIVTSLNKRVEQLDHDYDAIPGGTLLYRRTGAFISREEYTNSEVLRISEGKEDIEVERYVTTLPEFRRLTVEDRAPIVASTQPQEPFSDHYQQYLDSRAAVITKYGNLNKESKYDGIKNWISGMILLFLVFSNILFFTVNREKS